MRAAYPIMLDLTERLVVVVGGGPVAARKVCGLLDAGAKKICVVSPTFHKKLPAVVERITADYAPSHLTGAGLIFAATDSSEVNDAVVRDAKRLGILVNRADADDTEPGDFTTPAILRDGPLTVTVSTAGAPALAAKIRDELAVKLDPRWALMADAMRSLRPMVLASIPGAARRREIFHALATTEAMDALADGGTDSLRQWMTARFAELR